MSTNFPGSLDTLTNPQPQDYVAIVDHAAQHSNANDAIEALEAKVGVDGSAVQTSQDFKLSGVATGDKAASKTGTETLTNKTLTSPVLNTPDLNVGSDATGDVYYRGSDGHLKRLAIGSNGDVLGVTGGLPAYQSSASFATKAGVQNSSYIYAATATGNDTYVITLSPAPSSYTAGQRFLVKADVGNTGTASLNVNSLGAVTIKKNVSANLETGDIIAGQIFEVVYDGTNFQLQSKTGGSLASGNFNVGQATGSSSFTITHGLAAIPRLIKVTFSYTLTVGGTLTGGTSTGNAIISEGSIVSQQSVTHAQSGSTPGATTSSSVIGVLYYFSGGYSSTNVTLASVGASTFDLSFTNPGTGTVNVVWEAMI